MILPLEVEVDSSADDFLAVKLLVVVWVVLVAEMRGGHRKVVNFSKMHNYYFS